MPVPDYQACMMPLMLHANDGVVHDFGQACDSLAVHFKLTKEELRQLLPSGSTFIFRSRVGWARTYLTKACLLKTQGRGKFVITERGQQVLADPTAVVSTSYLRRYPEFLEFQRGTSSSNNVAQNGSTATVATSLNSTPLDDERTPDELLESAYLNLSKTLAQELLNQIQQCSPRFFEVLVIDLLVAMGYGGTTKDAAQVVGKSGDGGIDGIIKEDRLGLDVIYVQAKRWDGSTSVSRPEIQKFVGALQGHHASKGIFITTAKFSEQARLYVKNLPSKVILMDGEELSRHMIDFNVGVSVRRRYEVKKIDTDYFIEE